MTPDTCCCWIASGSARAWPSCCRTAQVLLTAAHEAEFWLLSQARTWQWSQPGGTRWRPGRFPWRTPPARSLRWPSYINITDLTLTQTCSNVWWFAVTILRVGIKYLLFVDYLGAFEELGRSITNPQLVDNCFFSKGKQWLCLLSKHHQIPDWLCQVLEAIPPELYVTNHKKWMSLRVGGGGGAGGVGLPFCCWCLGWSPEQRIKPASLHPSWCSLWTSVGTKSVSDILSWVLFTNCLKSDFVTCLWDGNVKL